MIEIDASDARRVQAELGQGTDEVFAKVPQVVMKGAVNVKDQLIREMGASKHFKGIVPGIDFDIHDAGLTAVIGPRKGSPGSLANIAYFGSSRGGGTVPEPQGALHDEAPNFIRELEKLAVEVL